MSENNAFQGNNSLTNTTTQRPLYSTIPVINLENYQQKTFQQYELSSAFLNNLLKKTILITQIAIKSSLAAMNYHMCQKIAYWEKDISHQSRQKPLSQVWTAMFSNTPFVGKWFITQNKFKTL